ncbi:MAG: hypothetical protein A3A81_04395 [Omnitrophica bacterium RIFCSPLOWO2_01_FULL_45_10b]|uniref:Uncharacterized protein n=1 Tax=Candidatus Wildermuthbacteria bacterium RIFCSPHIGHO2_02_FULL_47_12 TaxID=1802451 RepID=A0A1G2R3U5_9BACT|nr:MAG: hypothetical protein A3A81_04395 [Omnitrophica bacterium RIFCSPLOWO2_01_FULL_45_10b]OHA67530.1 MAG: hypothetical protein A3C82_02250 [Candidatus Wildermuthbacteria bacterium RIFCSPHIGHO2_02_FULL_47_12]
MKKLFLLLLIPFLITAGCGKKEEKYVQPEKPTVQMKKEIQESVGLETAPVERKKLVSYIEVYGSIAQDTENTVHVAPKGKCILKELKVKVGETVDENSPIAVVQTSSGEEQILSPCHGIVISQYVKEGDAIDPLTSVVTIANPDLMRASFDVYEKDFGKIEMGQKVEITTTAYANQVFDGKVVFVSPRVDENTRTVKIRVDIENKDHFLKFGMSVNGNIRRESEEEFLVAPLEAIQEVENAKNVFVKINEETFEVRPVSVGIKTDQEAAIAEGLVEGEVIVTQGSFVLKSELLKGELGEE